MNSINLIGNICSAPELKQTTNGKSVVSFNLAVSRPYAKDTTDFIPLVIWGQPAEYISRYATKGTKIAVSGKLTTRNYEDKQGNKRTAFEVLVDTAEICESKATTEPSIPDPRTLGNKYMPDAYKSPQFEELDNNEGLPF